MALLSFCSSSGTFDLSDPCIRAAWSSVIPAVLVGAYCLYRIPLPGLVRKGTSYLKEPFRSFLTVAEAEAYDADDVASEGHTSPHQRAPLWLTFVLSGIAALQTTAWAALTILLVVANDRPDSTSILFSALMLFSWFYASVKPVFEPKTTPPYDLFALYIVMMLGSILVFGGILFDASVYDEVQLDKRIIIAHSFNLLSILTLLISVLSRPLAIPSTKVNKEEIGKSISPEDYTTLWGWLSFNWIQPLISRGTYDTLNESDVWELSVTMRARPVFRKFSDTKRKTLLRQLWASNSMDIIVDFILTFASVFFQYGGPFFLKRIIDAIDNPVPGRNYVAYIYACLMLCSQVLNAEADVLHLWHGRRAAVRIRSELMSAIYEKALKRKDFSGIVNKDSKNEKENAVKGDENKSDNPKAGADTGKIVNLMAGDSNRIAMVVSGMYFIYGAPLEIIIASIFLYRLLGISAFAGAIVILIGWPLNNYIARRSIRIQKSALAARDSRMGVLNELIGAVKFIKFFAWEDRWIERAMEARKKEIQWLVKSRINSIMFQALWTTAPILVSVLSFFAYVAQGNELTVGTAFTAIALFTMIREPLNVIPMWIVQILQTQVALQRIETFLEEDEVDEQVSTLKHNITGSTVHSYTEFGLRNASFNWNAIDSNDDAGKASEQQPKKTGNTDRNGDIEAQDDVIAVADAETGHRFELRDISVVFPDGELSVITGPTASGKTALLLAMLGEMTLLPGGEILMSKEPSKVDNNGLTHAISYAAQTPWLQHQTIKENILFGNPYDEARYNEVVECCALLPDFQILEDGDETEIGARGVSLSGGQKARVALARAAYAQTKYVLLDDPLSAVDSHTSRFLFERLFLGPLMKHRTIVLVTHHVELVLSGAYYIVRMLDGRIDVQGTVKDLRASGVLNDIALESAIEVEQEQNQMKTAVVPKKDIEESGSPQVNVSTESTVTKTKKPRKLVKDEERETGSVKWAIYKTYLKASSYWTWAALIFLVALRQGLGFAEKFWVKIWGDAYEKYSVPSLVSSFARSTAVEQQALLSDFQSQQFVIPIHETLGTQGFADNLPSGQEHPLFYVAVYALIGFVVIVITLTSVTTQVLGALRASRKLFKQLLVSVVHATMRWHDVTPTGRMLNRFSKDIETVDLSLANSLQAVNSSLASFIASMIVVVAVFPPFLIPASIIGYFYYQLALGYLNTGRDLRRMESTSRSPIFSGFGELLEGIVTVRAFSAEHRFLNNLYQKVDLTLQMWYSFWMTNRWLLLRFDCLGALAVFTTSLFALSVDSTKTEGWAGWAALCITSAMAFTNNIYWACRFWTQLELDFNSVERVVEYLELPQEPPAVIENSRPPAHWPSSTGPNSDSLLVVQDLEVRYAPDLPAVLHDISFNLKATERVGLLGRTGSGKSTLAMSVLRFVDPTKGKILVDGIDITTIGVSDLRSRLTFIPQDATLFSGSLRDNLDPFGDYSDIECMDALHRVHLIDDSAYTSQHSSKAPSIHRLEREDTDVTIVSESTITPSGSTSGVISSASSVTEVGRDATSKGNTKITLDTEVSAGGLNFSAGQRQLIAMARALLRQSAVIILDEATSSIDFATDAKIQKTIREEFSNSLLLTIAHRLRTVIDYDRLIVLDAGKIAEIDTPYNLIRKEGSIFRGMCLKSGSLAELEEAARIKAEKDVESLAPK